MLKVTVNRLGLNRFGKTILQLKDNGSERAMAKGGTGPRPC